MKWITKLKKPRISTRRKSPFRFNKPLCCGLVPFCLMHKNHCICGATGSFSLKRNIRSSITKYEELFRNDQFYTLSVSVCTNSLQSRFRCFFIWILNVFLSLDATSLRRRLFFYFFSGIFFSYSLHFFVFLDLFSLSCYYEARTCNCMLGFWLRTSQQNIYNILNSNCKLISIHCQLRW